MSAIFRETVSEHDIAVVREIVSSSGYFSAAEIDVAAELVEERLSKGESSGYHLVFCEREGRVVGYACFGPIPCTMRSFDLYWIAVHEAHRGGGVGRALMERTERAIACAGGERVYIETSGRAQYESTRAFYGRCGYRQEAQLNDFYGLGDAKLIYVKVLSKQARS